jgi:hypothetical protein
MNKKSNERLEVHQHASQISLEELTTDVSAFLHFLSENYEGDKGNDLPSFWMLIPKSLDIEYRCGTSEFFLEKEIFSRKILIVAEPLPDFLSPQERREKRAELLSLFQNAFTGDQTQQLLLLLTRLRPEARQKIVENFQRFQDERKDPS